MLDKEKINTHLQNMEAMARRMLAEATIVRKHLGENITHNSAKKEQIQMKVNAALLRREKSFMKSLRN